MKKNRMTVVDLFCGAGGLSKGFIDAGFNVILGVDNDAVSLETFKLNHNGSKVLLADLFDKKSMGKIKDALTDSPDVIIGGPPCQGFSLTGTRNFDDKRNQLYRS